MQTSSKGKGDPTGLQIEKALEAIGNFNQAAGNTAVAVSRYTNDFLIPLLISANYFQRVEQRRSLDTGIHETLEAYCGLFNFSLSLGLSAIKGLGDAMYRYATVEAQRAFRALETLGAGDGSAFSELMQRKADLAVMLAQKYPEAIDAIESEFGFHFERGRDVLVDETDRFLLYQIMPTDAKVEVREGGKPILIVPPYVLGANILAFLPGENRSYTHSFANQGVPTYIRILKDIQQSEAMQTMNGDDDALDTRRFCQKIYERHGRAITLNGYCQGGFSALCNLLTGKLDDLVDAFITCVAPMDGTRSQGLSGFLKDLPQRFNDLAYGTKTLKNGNTVADGALMGWVYKLKSIETESPISAFLRDLMMFSHQGDGDFMVGKTAAALNYWLNYERNDLPIEITKMSFASYNHPISADGILPVTLFGQQLDLHRLKARKLPWLICYGENDDLVEPAVALAPRDFVEAEVAAFPKGHVAMATSWSAPNSDCALHTRFGEEQYRGPVRFHLDLEAADSV
jgi:hypothetical protein